MGFLKNIFGHLRLTANCSLNYLDFLKLLPPRLVEQICGVVFERRERLRRFHAGEVRDKATTLEEDVGGERVAELAVLGHEAEVLVNVALQFLADLDLAVVLLGLQVVEVELVDLQPQIRRLRDHICRETKTEQALYRGACDLFSANPELNLLLGVEMLGQDHIYKQ